MSPSRATSAATKRQRSPSSRASRSPRFSSRSASTTEAPSAMNSRAVASPMPLAAPVITARLPASLSRPRDWEEIVERVGGGLGAKWHLDAPGRESWRRTQLASTYISRRDFESCRCRRIGCIDGCWRDTVLMERRSAVVVEEESRFTTETRRTRKKTSQKQKLGDLCGSVVNGVL